MSWECNECDQIFGKPARDEDDNPICPHCNSYDIVNKSAKKKKNSNHKKELIPEVIFENGIFVKCERCGKSIEVRLEKYDSLRDYRLVPLEKCVEIDESYFCMDCEQDINWYFMTKLFDHLSQDRLATAQEYVRHCKELLAEAEDKLEEAYNMVNISGQWLLSEDITKTIENNIEEIRNISVTDYKLYIFFSRFYDKEELK